MNILICDDNQAELDSLYDMLLNRSFSANEDFSVRKFTEPEKAALSDTKYDIAFLDVEMDKLSGIELAEILTEKNPDIKIIMVTAYNRYLDDAMKIRVFRYLSKPVESGRLFRALDDAVREIHKSSVCIITNHGNEVNLIPVREILYLESSKHGCVIHTQNGSFPSGKRIGRIVAENMLENSFVEVCSGICANLACIRSFDNRSAVLQIGDCSATVNVSQRKYKILREKFFKYYEDKI